VALLDERSVQRQLLGQRLVRARNARRARKEREARARQRALGRQRVQQVADGGGGRGARLEDGRLAVREARRLRGGGEKISRGRRTVRKTL
jgi:hypothetical protein